MEGMSRIHFLKHSQVTNWERVPIYPAIIRVFRYGPAVLLASYAWGLMAQRRLVWSYPQDGNSKKVHVMPLTPLGDAGRKIESLDIIFYQSGKNSILGKED